MIQQRSMRTGISLPAMALPYIAVLVGLFGLRSAWAALLLYNGGMLVVIAARGVRCKAARFGLPGWVVACAIVVSAAAGPSIFFAADLVSSAPWSDTLRAVGLSGASWRWFVVYFALVHPVVEETFWRGALDERHGLLALQDFAFGGYHALVLSLFLRPLFVVISTLGLVAVAALWRAMRDRSSGLALPLVTHAVADISIILSVSFVVGAH